MRFRFLPRANVVPAGSGNRVPCARASREFPLLTVHGVMSALKQVMQVIGSHHISNQLLESDCDKSGGLISNGEYAWFAAGANIILYSKQLGSVVSSRSFAADQRDKSLTVSRATTSAVLKTTGLLGTYTRSSERYSMHKSVILPIST